MRSLARWGALPLLGMPLSTWALTLGEIELNSYLNQPLNAEIGFSATADELATLSVSLAEPARFLGAGLDYPAFLNSLEFRITRNDAGDSIIAVSSRQAISEPFVTIIVTASHSRGSLSREYTMLLDPPLFLPEAAAAEPIAAPVTRPEPAAAGGAIAREPAPAPAPAPAPSVTAPAEPIAEPVAAPAAAPEAPAESAPEPVSEAAPEPAPAPSAAPSAAQAGASYTVVGGDTLWGITNRVRPAGVSMNQAMLAIFEANPAAFDGNINRLRRGAILRIPPATSLNTMGAADATAEVQRQIDVWRGVAEAAPQLVLRPPAEEPASLGLTIGGDADAEAAEPEPVVADLDEAAVTPAEDAGAERLIEVTSNALSDLQQQLADSPEAEPAAEPEALFADEVDAEPAAVAEEAVADAEPAAEPEPESSARSAPIVTQTDSPSVVDQIIGWVTQPIFAIGAGVVVVLLAALAFLRRRRDAVDDVTGEWEALEAEIGEEADNAATDRMRAPSDADMVVVEGSDHTDTIEEESASEGGIFEVPDLTAEPEEDDLPTFDPGTTEIEQLGDFVTGQAADEVEFEGDETISTQTVIDLDQADPIAEADFHMAYGLYDQAADLISKALESEPGSRVLKLKLLEVYFVWGNKEQFLASATALRDEIGAERDPDWDKVVIMGKQICPDDALFAEAIAAAGEVDLDLAGSGTGVGLDFAFDEAEDDAAADDAFDLDIDIAADSGELSLEASDITSVGTPADDESELLDIGSETQAGLEAALFDETDDDGALTQPGDHLEDVEEAQDSPTMETAMPDFADSPTIESPTLSVPAAEATSEMTAELDLDDLGLDLGDLPVDISDMPDSDSDGGDLLAATGSTQVLDPRMFEDAGDSEEVASDDSAESILEADFDSDTARISTEVLEQQPVSGLEPEPVRTESDLDLNLDDFSTALGGDTVEQPLGDLDLDVGQDVPADDEPTGTEAMGAGEPQTMTEVGTKLDLARAYIDMGDPDGAKSILEEVLSEGDSGQRSEAEALISALPG